MQIVSVVIPHYHDLSGLNLCLAALCQQTYPRDCFEIVVADNNSPEGIEAVAKVVGNRAKLITVLEQGAGPARNGGVNFSVGEVLAFIDSDCRPEREWMVEGVKALAVFDFVGGRVNVEVDDVLNMTGAEAFERVFAFDFEHYIEKKGFTGTGNLFCGRALFECLGGFRSGLSEDVEWSHRARKAGYRLGYAPKAVVAHPARKTWVELRNKWRRINAETYALRTCTVEGRLTWVAKSLALPASAVIHSGKVLISKNLYTPRQRIAAIGILFRLRWWRMIDSFRLLFHRVG